MASIAIWRGVQVISAVCMAGALVGTQARTIAAIRAAKPPVIDGVIDDHGEWSSAAKIEGMVDTYVGNPAPYRAEFWLEYDAKFVYFAARLYDPVPGQIQASEYRTNVSLVGEDIVELLLSPFGTFGDFNLVQLNARGAANIEPAGGRALKREWLGEVSSKARITATGWEVETRIPWRLFKMPTAGIHDMRLNIRRRMPRLSRAFSLAYTAAGHQIDTPIWQRVVVPKIALDHSIKGLAYGDLGVETGSSPIANGGFDLKTNLTDSVTAVASVNPDFRDVEDPILSLDFSRFARLPGDNRPFFQEGANYYNSKIFASEQIPDFAVGLSAYGSLNPKTRFGILSTTTFGKEADLVANVTTNPDPLNTFSVAMTNVERPGFENEASVLRWNHLSGGFRLAGIDSQTVDSNLGRGAADTILLNYVGHGFYSGARLERVTPNYAPGLGFQPEVDYEGGQISGGFDRQFDKGAIQQDGLFAVGVSYRRLEGGFYRDSITGGGDLLLRNQLLLAGSFFADRFESDKDHTFSFDAQYPENDMRRQISIDVTAGMQEELPYNSYSARGTYAFGPRLSTSLAYQIVQLGTSYQEQVVWSMNTDLRHDRYVGGRLVQTTGGTNAYVSVQQSGNRGVEYFLIVGDPNAAPVDNRRYLINFRPCAIIKVVVPFQIGSSGGG